MNRASFGRRFLPALVILSGLLAPAAPRPDAVQKFRAVTPAGYEVIDLTPSGATVSLLGLVECPEMEGAQQVAGGSQAHIVNAAGEMVTFFPSHFSFRITASLRRTVLENASYSLKTNEDPRQFLLKLGFRLKMYDGLQVRSLAPEKIEMIGMPADVPYDERVYRVSFGIGRSPITNRFVLEVLSPEGERLSRFHFELL